MNAKKAKLLRKQLRMAFKLPTLHRSALYDDVVRKYVERIHTDTGALERVPVRWQRVMQRMCPRFIYKRTKRIIVNARR